MREDEAIAEVRSIVPVLEDLRGPGDDAAVLSRPEGNLVWAIDLMVEGRHFDRSISSLADAAFKAVARNASDLAAMGAQPLAFLAGVTMPEASRIDVTAVAEGFRDAATTFGLPLAGGDLSRSDRFSFAVTVLGTVDGRGLGRDGASEGDRVYLTGALGAAAAGLLLHRRSDPAAKELLEAFPVLSQRHRRGCARLEAGQALLRSASSCMDVSDGLVKDLHRLARASGCTIEIDRTSVPLEPGVTEAAELLAVDAWDLATAGDDYELVFTAAEPPRGVDATEIGRVSSGAPAVMDTSGRELEGGHDHFA